MSYKFRCPPKMYHPKSSRWLGVIRISPNAEIWFLDLRRALPYYYFAVFCDVTNEIVIPRYQIPQQEQALKKDKHLLKGWGHRFFWSDNSMTLVIQLLLTFEYSERVETEQIFLSGKDFEVTKTLTNQDVLLFPHTDFKEVFPEMHPDRSRPD